MDLVVREKGGRGLVGHGAGRLESNRKILVVRDCAQLNRTLLGTCSMIDDAQRRLREVEWESHVHIEVV